MSFLRAAAGFLPTAQAAARHAGPAASVSCSRAFSSANGVPVEVHNEKGKHRVVVTKNLPGERWLNVLKAANCRVEICTHEATILDNDTIVKLIGDDCMGVLGQLTEDWGTQLFGSLSSAGGVAYSNYAVGYNNVDVKAATKAGIPVGNTPGVLTETTAELAAALTLAAARRVVEADRFMRGGKYEGWLPNLFVGNLLQNKTVGIVGAGRIGAAYARMFAEGHKMDIVYFDPYPNKKLEEYITKYGQMVESFGERGPTIRKLETVEEVLQQADVVSLHCALDDKSKHLMNKERLEMMKPDAILINAARGPVHDETALVAHLQSHPDFRVGLDVFEDEPKMKPGLAECDNAVIVPHIASASFWTRSAMATIAACNVAACIKQHPVWTSPDMLPFVDGPEADIPKAAPSIVNASDLGMPKKE